VAVELEMVAACEVGLVLTLGTEATASAFAPDSSGIFNCSVVASSPNEQEAVGQFASAVTVA
jgi:hypothetical protein